MGLVLTGTAAELTESNPIKMHFGGLQGGMTIGIETQVNTVRHSRHQDTATYMQFMAPTAPAITIEIITSNHVHPSKKNRPYNNFIAQPGITEEISAQTARSSIFDNIYAAYA